MYVNKNINICESLNKYEEKCIYFCDSIKNNIINDGNFIRILYSKSFVLLNGIYLYFSLNIQSVEKYYNKLKCNFNITYQSEIIEKIKTIEENILKKINLNKIPQYKLFEQFKNGNIKIFNDFDQRRNQMGFCCNDSFLDHANPNPNPNPSMKTNKEMMEWCGQTDFVLKISGIWENELYYGLTFKFIKPNDV